MTTVCQICVNGVNLTKHKIINCPYCQFAACRTCCETYVLNETSFKCMSPDCGREWTRQFQTTVFTATFINGRLKQRREQLLFDNERALLPSTQPVVETMIKRENLEKNLSEVKKKMNELSIQRYAIMHEIHLLRTNQPSERTEFIKSCPDSNCRGFLSSQWKCGICEKWSCPHCHEVKGENRDAPHECNPETVATVSLLANDTKPCPKCRTRIFKINGCDEMFCTNCHTGFNWRTGRIQETIHNPHYFEWLRRNGNAVPRTPGDVPCRNEITHNIYIAMKNKLLGRHKNHAFSIACEQFMAKLIRNVIHMRYVIMPTYNIGNHMNRNEYLRIQYMRNIISEVQFKTQLQRNEKRVEKKREIHNVLDIILTTLTDIILRFEAHLNTAEIDDWNMDILEEIDPIVDYANGCLLDISRVYKSRVIQFSNEIRLL